METTPTTTKSKNWALGGKAGRFVMVPEEVIYDLKGNTLRVFMVLCSRVSGATGQVVVSRETVSSITGIHINNISGIYTELTSKGYIKFKKQVSLNGANKFQLSVPDRHDLTEKMASIKAEIKDKKDTFQNDIIGELEFSKDLFDDDMYDEAKEYARELRKITTIWSNRNNWRVDHAGIVVNKYDTPIRRLNEELIYEDDKDAVEALIERHMQWFKEYMEALS